MRPPVARTAQRNADKQTTDHLPASHRAAWSAASLTHGRSPPQTIQQGGLNRPLFYHDLVAEANGQVDQDVILVSSGGQTRLSYETNSCFL